MDAENGSGPEPSPEPSVGNRSQPDKNMLKKLSHLHLAEQTRSDNMDGMVATPEVPTKIHKLPDEILLLMFSELPLPDLTSCANVCRRWHCLIKGRRSLWRGKTFTAFEPASFKQVRMMAAIMPKLDIVRIIGSWRDGIFVAWPEVVVLADIFDQKKSHSLCVFCTDVLTVSLLTVEIVKDILNGLMCGL